MNTPPATPPRTAPFLAIYASGKPPLPYKQALQPENPSLVIGPFQPWTSCLTSGTDRLPPIDDRRTAYRTIGMPMGTWDPGRHPAIVVRRKPLMQPEAVAPAAAKAKPVPWPVSAVELPEQAIRPEEAGNGPAKLPSCPGNGRGDGRVDGIGPVGTAIQAPDQPHPGRGSVGKGPRYSVHATRGQAGGHSLRHCPSRSGVLDF